MGNLFRSQATLLSETSGVTATVTGTTYLLKPRADNVPDPQHVFQLQVNSTGASMSTASITPKLQTSWDGTNWIDAATGTAITADGSLSELKPTTANLGPYVRAVVTISGTATYTGTAFLVANAPFSLAAIS